MEKTVADLVREFMKVVHDEGRTCLAVTTSSNYACVPSYDSALSYVKEGKSIVTSQFYILSEPCAKEYDVILLHKNGSIARIDIEQSDGEYKLECRQTDREIRYAHDLVHLFVCNEFNEVGSYEEEELIR